jgi:uncharacterized sulfatase
MGLLMRGEDAVAMGLEDLQAALKDLSPYVRIAAAEALGKYGKSSVVPAVETVLAECADPAKNNVFVTLAALSAIEAIGIDEFPDLVMKLKAHSWAPEAPYARYREYVPQFAESLLGSPVD